MSISRTTQTKLYNKVMSDVEEEVKRLYDERVVSTTRHVRGVPPQTGGGEGEGGSGGGANSGGGADTGDAGQQSDNIIKTRTFKLGAHHIDIQQAFSSKGKPLCMKCEGVIPGLSCNFNISNDAARLHQNTNYQLSKLPFQGRFCSLDCSKGYGIKSNSRYVRNVLFDLELGVCQLCGFDTEQFMRQLKLCEPEERVKMLNSSHYKTLSGLIVRRLYQAVLYFLIFKSNVAYSTY